MRDPQPHLTCPRCGAEAHSALPLCTACGALFSVPLGATALRPQGFGHEPSGEVAPVVVTAAPEARALTTLEPRPFLAPAAMPAALDAGALAPAPLEPTPVPPPVSSPPVATAAPPAPPAGKKRRRKPQAPSAEEQLFAQYGLAPPAVSLGPASEGPAPAPPAPAGLLAEEAPPTGPRWDYPPQQHPGAPPTHAPPAYVPQPLAVPRGGSAARPAEATPKVSGLAIAGFILALACGPLGLVLSLIAFARIKASKGRLRGEWLAVLGVIAGVVWLLLWSAGKQQKPTKPRRAAVTLTLPVA
jgi:hypothetical protein